MKKKLIVLLLLLFLCERQFLPDTPDTADSSKTLEFLQGDGVYETGRDGLS